MSTQLVLIAVCLIALEDRSGNDLQRLQGTWVLVAMEREGEPVPAEDTTGMTVVYEGNRMTLRSGGKDRRHGIITLNPDRKPRAINTWDQDGPYEDQTVPGIYELDGDTLRMAFARPGQERPEKFTTREGAAVLYCVYKRQKR